MNASKRAAFFKKMNKMISLNGEWRIRWNDAERGGRIARVLWQWKSFTG